MVILGAGVGGGELSYIRLRLVTSRGRNRCSGDVTACRRRPSLSLSRAELINQLIN